jgi:hypothetical protein
VETAEGSELDIVSTRQWLVWTGLSDTSNPSSAKKAINNVAKAVVKDLEKEGIF